jgi:hypothetical protein
LSGTPEPSHSAFSLSTVDTYSNAHSEPPPECGIISTFRSLGRSSSSRINLRDLRWDVHDLKIGDYTTTFMRMRPPFLSVPFSRPDYGHYSHIQCTHTWASMAREEQLSLPPLTFPLPAGTATLSYLSHNSYRCRQDYVLCLEC